MALLGPARLFVWSQKSYLHVYLDLQGYCLELDPSGKLKKQLFLIYELFNIDIVFILAGFYFS